MTTKEQRDAWRARYGELEARWRDAPASLHGVIQAEVGLCALAVEAVPALLDHVETQAKVIESLGLTLDVLQRQLGESNAEIEALKGRLADAHALLDTGVCNWGNHDEQYELNRLRVVCAEDRANRAEAIVEAARALVTAPEHERTKRPMQAVRQALAAYDEARKP